MSNNVFRGLKPDGTLGATATGQVQAMIDAASKSYKPTREQIFTAIGAALHIGDIEPPASHEYGLPVIWLDTSVQRQRSAWVPKAPVFDFEHKTYIIPRDEGVTYTVAGKDTAPGVYPVVPPASISVQATAMPGYTLAGRTSWDAVFEESLAPYDILALGASPEFYWRMDDATSSTSMPRNRGQAEAPYFNSRIASGTFAEPGVGLGPTAFQAGTSGTMVVLSDDRVFSEFSLSLVTVLALKSPELVPARTWDGRTSVSVRMDPWGSSKATFSGKVFGVAFSKNLGISDGQLGRPIHIGVTLKSGIFAIFLDGLKIHEQAISGEHTLSAGISLAQATGGTIPLGGLMLTRSSALSEATMIALGEAVKA
ncbi:hypothetical protein [Rothia nasimurium]|uniref:hypothetical protein n=1 Tax=Rothia nasimurium TaxID=85336 RepID=UPI001F219D44|nr:hypothetical protein [Rothia nasimurium]